MIHRSFRLGDKVILLAVPQTDDEFERGLLDHDVITDEFGMLFHPAVPLHTHGMNFSIDVIWYGREGLLVVDECVPSGLKLPVPEGATAAIEVASGFARRHGLTP